MKKTARVIMTAMVIVAALLTSACQNGNAKANESGEKTYNIGIVQPVEHKALDAAKNGFIAALSDNGYKAGENVNYDMQNAQGDMSNLSTIGDRFVNNKVDLVLAIATDPAQSMAAKTTTIPIIGTAITSFSIAGLVDSEEKPGGNITGTSDMNPVAEQIELITELVPDIETIGLIYNNGEDNSVLQADIAKEKIEALGLKWSEVTVLNSNEIQQAMQSLVNKCEAVYIPTDNILASAMPTVHSVAQESKTPVICAEAGMVEEGGLASMGAVNYYDLGYKAGLMAVEVLEGSDPAQMPIQYADPGGDIIINGVVADEIGYEVPEELKKYVVYP